MNQPIIQYSEFVRKLAKSGELIAETLNDPDLQDNNRLLNFTTTMAMNAGDLMRSVGEYIQRDNDFNPDTAHALHMAVGIAGEVGELLDAVKKVVIYNKPIDMENVVEELGDIEFYLTGLELLPETFNGVVNIRQNLSAIYYMLKLSRGHVLEANMSKLHKRYENAVYSDKAAMERADKV